MSYHSVSVLTVYEVIEDHTLRPDLSNTNIVYRDLKLIATWKIAHKYIGNVGSQEANEFQKKLMKSLGSMVLLIPTCACILKAK